MEYFCNIKGCYYKKFELFWDKRYQSEKKLDTHNINKNSVS